MSTTQLGTKMAPKPFLLAGGGWLKKRHLWLRLANLE